MKNIVLETNKFNCKDSVSVRENVYRFGITMGTFMVHLHFTKANAKANFFFDFFATQCKHSL